MKDYPLAVPPTEELGNTPARKYTPKQAREYFEWYISDVPNRLAQLEDYVNDGNERPVKFDDSRESLIALWSWFEDLICADFEAAKKMHPDTPEEDLVTTKNATIKTLAIGRDISLYFAKVFIKYNPTVHWGYYTRPKSDMDVNRPVLLGFLYNLDINPVVVISSGILKTFKKRNPNYLVEALDSGEEDVAKDADASDNKGSGGSQPAGFTEDEATGFLINTAGVPLLIQDPKAEMVDCTFKIEDMKRVADFLYFTMNALYKGEPVGFNAQLYCGTDSDGMHLAGGKPYYPAVSFLRAGAQSDRFLEVYRALCDLPGDAPLTFIEKFSFSGLILEPGTIDLSAQTCSIKLFGNEDKAEEDPDLCFESFIDLDIAHGYVSWQEKDASYRDVLLASLSQAS